MRRRLPLVIAAVVVLLVPLAAWARLGGGESWGGGGSGGSGSDAIDLICCILELFYYLAEWVVFCVECPQVGLPVTAVVIVGGIALIRFSPKNTGVSSVGTLARIPPKRSAATERLPFDRLRQRDPYFSLPLFLDFVQLLYARFHVLRGSRKLAALRPYVDKGTLDRAARETPKEVREVDRVLIGATRVASLDLTQRTRMVLELTANYREVGTETTTWYAVERWTLTRASGARSKPPEEIVRLGCPSCGSAAEPRADGSCPSCGQTAKNGRFHWFVSRIEVAERRAATAFSPPSGEESGTDLATVVSPTLAEDRRGFLARHAQFSWEAFEAQVRETFLALQKAWSDQSWEQARPFETDSLFSTHRYWIEQYRAAGLVNRLDEIQVERVELAKVETDAFYEAVTVRVFASGLDFTVDRSDKVVAGSRTDRRSFSEYWTLVRRIGREGKASPVRGGCPSCGATLAINMAGVCEHCGSMVASGDFGWVLSRIEQDDEYAG